MDLAGVIIDDLARRPQSAFILLFIGGMLSAFGPCGAQRALGFVASSTHRKTRSTGYFYAAGIVVAGMALLLSTSVLRKLAETSQFSSAIMAAVCLTVGIVGLWRADVHACDAHGRSREMTGLSTFALGFGTSLLVAPCCAPFLLFVAAYAPANMLWIDAFAYSLGCAVPYLISGAVVDRVVTRFATVAMRQALRIVSSTIALALGLLYIVETL